MENADDGTTKDAARQHSPYTKPPELRSDAGSHEATTAEPEDKSRCRDHRRRHGNLVRKPSS
jgi:hypothetical protein